jgi:hypothetical protein
MEEKSMKKTLATVAAVGVTATSAPRAEERGIGPGLAFGLAAGALAASAAGAYVTDIAQKPGASSGLFEL